MAELLLLLWRRRLGGWGAAARLWRRPKVLRGREVGAHAVALSQPDMRHELCERASGLQLGPNGGVAAGGVTQYDVSHLRGRRPLVSAS